MVLTVQNNDGDEAGADTYIGIMEATDILTNLGREAGWLETSVDDKRREQALRSARLFLDTNWRYLGTKLSGAQTTAFPRTDLTDEDGFDVDGISSNVKTAQALLAVEDIAGPLYNTQRVTPGTTAGTYQSEIKIGPITQKFSESRGTATTITEASFPEVEALLAPFFDASGNDVLVG